MHRSQTLLGVLVVAMLALHQCAPPSRRCSSARWSRSPGTWLDLAADLRKSLLLWQEEVNAAGGLLGRRVELRAAG